MKLDELIKYVWENHEIFFKEYIKETFFTKDYRSSVTFYKDGSFVTNTCIDSDDIFQVEIEEEITEDTKFHLLVGNYFLEEIESYDSITYYNRSIDDVRDRESESIYALIDNKLQLIWERDNQ